MNLFNLFSFSRLNNNKSKIRAKNKKKSFYVFFIFFTYSRFILIKKYIWCSYVNILNDFVFFAKIMNAYEILECCDKSTNEEIKMQYHKLLLKYHPDKTADINTNKFHQLQTGKFDKNILQSINLLTYLKRISYSETKNLVLNMIIIWNNWN